MQLQHLIPTVEGPVLIHLPKIWPYVICVHTGTPSIRQYATTNQLKGLEPACIFTTVSIVITCWQEHPLSCAAVNASNRQANKKVMSTNSDLQSEQEAVNVTSTNKLKTKRCCFNYCCLVLFCFLFFLAVCFVLMAVKISHRLNNLAAEELPDTGSNSISFPAH